MKPENCQDRNRFEKMKQTELEHGRTEEKAIEVAARETKTMREREGRGKDDKDEPPRE